jgi:SAM-dependent methyltransferase
MAPVAVQDLRSFKQNIKAMARNHFWLQYSMMAGYRVFCACASALTGRTFSGAAHAENSVGDAIAYIEKVFQDYKSAAGVERFCGRIAEIGPGDSCGIGLMFLTDGCRQVDLVDRFFSKRDEQQQQTINRAIVQRWPQLGSCLRDQRFSESSFAGLTRYYGAAAAAETFFEKNRNYDFIVSCAVLEHVYDPLRALAAMVSALNPGGMMLHQVDCRDHGQFSSHFHELKFLELPRTLYSPLGWGGGPNRIRLDAYCKALQQQPVETQIYVTTLAGIPDRLPHGATLEQVPKDILETSRRYVSSVRSRLAGPFRDMADEDLMVTSFLLVAKKIG